MSTTEQITSAHPSYRRWRLHRAPTAGTLNEYWIEVLDRDVSLRDVVLCVELVFGMDKIVRISDKPCRTRSSATGDEYSFAAVLQDRPSIVQSYSFGTATSSARTLSFKLPNVLVDVQRLVADGRLLAGVAEVSLQVNGGDFDERFVLMRGDMSDGITFAAIDELVELTIEDPKVSVDVYTPPFVIDANSFGTTPADAAIGQRYALVIPKYDGVPAPFVSTSATSAICLVGYGTLDDSTNYIKIDGTRYSSTHPVYAYTWEQAQDLDGATYTRIRFGASGSGTFEFSEQVYAYPSSGVGGDTPLGQVRTLLERYTALGSIGLSDELFAAAQAKIGTLSSRMLVNAGGASTTTALAFVEGEFLNSFPMVSMLFHGSGYGPIVIDRRSEVVAMRLDAKQWPVLDRASYVTETAKADCANEFVLSYAYDPVEDVYAGIETRDATNSLLCSISQQQIGYRPADVIESPYIHDADTARAVVDWMIDHYTLPSYLVEYDVDASLVLRLKPGDNVSITDDEFGWQGIIATVESIEFNPTHCRVLLRVWWRYYTLGTGASTGGGGGGGGGGQPGGGGN